MCSTIITSLARIHYKAVLFSQNSVLGPIERPRCSLFIFSKLRIPFVEQLKVANYLEIRPLSKTFQSASLGVVPSLHWAGVQPHTSEGLGTAKLFPHPS